MLRQMRAKTYAILAVAAFAAVVTGSDVAAAMVVRGLSLVDAFEQHLEWASHTVLGILFLFAPYALAALICAGVNAQGRTRTAAALFALSLGALSYFYVVGFYAAEQAMVDQRWTAAALSVGLLPVFVGGPVLFALIAAALIAGVVGDVRAARRSGRR